MLIRLPGAKGQIRSVAVSSRGAAVSPSAISCDIPSRTSIFRTIAPSVGNEVVLDRGEKTEALSEGYVPHPGDRLLILVTPSPEARDISVTIENKPNGEVLLTTPGGVPRLLARVKQPLRGIGRYAGTERAGSGTVLSWSPTAALVATAGRLHGEQAPEERGGFVIQPAEPKLQGITNPASQILLEALQEGMVKPPVSPFFGLPAPLS